MRSLIVLGTAGIGAWLMVNFCQSWSATLSAATGSAQSPLGALLFVPSLLVGALIGAVVGSLICPFRS
jgi:ribose/xylose/arabinose/galactoside ABC-type transport system permease subunit